MGDHNLSAGVREFTDYNSYEMMVQEMAGGFVTANFAETIRILDKNFGASVYTIKSLYPDEQRRI